MKKQATRQKRGLAATLIGTMARGLLARRKAAILANQKYEAEIALAMRLSLSPS